MAEAAVQAAGFPVKGTIEWRVTRTTGQAHNPTFTIVPVCKIFTNVWNDAM